MHDALLAMPWLLSEKLAGVPNLELSLNDYYLAVSVHLTTAKEAIAALVEIAYDAVRLKINLSDCDPYPRK